MAKRNKHTRRADKKLPGRKPKIKDWLGPKPQLVPDDGVQLSEIMTRRYSSTKPGNTDDTPLANPVQQDTRHYCRECKRKREERFMVVVGRGAFGKQSWACNDNRKLCAAIRTAKQKEAARHDD